jgi:hypothetical protein
MELGIMGDYKYTLQLYASVWLVPSFQFILHHRNRKCHFIGLVQCKNLLLVIVEPSCAMSLGSTQPLTEMSTRNLPGGKKRPVCRADNLAAICELNV